MSMSPGTTYSPVASATRRAEAGGIEAATRAIFPPVIATSMTASIVFLGSMTCPFRISRSNSGPWAFRAGVIVAITEDHATTRRRDRYVTRATPFPSEAHFLRKLQLPRQPVLRGNRAERRTRGRGVGILEVGAVQRVVGLDTELELASAA